MLGMRPIPVRSLICCSMLAIVPAGLGDTLRVPDTFATVQAAIDAAMPGDLILVGPGLYEERIDLGGKAIELRAEDGPEVTTLSGTSAGTVITCDSGETGATVIEGFTVTGGRAINGAGLLIDGASPTVRACVFEANFATGTTIEEGGGGLAVLNGGAPLIADCVFRNNLATSLGGAILNIQDTSPTFVNCLVHDNDAEFGGGFANEIGGSIRIINTTIANNTALVAPGICNFRCTVTIANTISWGHSQDLTNLPGGAANISASIIGSGVTGPGVSTADPRLVSASDFSLRDDSPAIDAGTNNAPAIASVLKDLAGKPRFADDPNTPDTGTGTGPIIDIGAYEFAVACLCETTGDTDVGIADLLEYLSGWFAEDPGADLDGDGSVGVTDLLTFLACWFEASGGTTC